MGMEIPTIGNGVGFECYPVEGYEDLKYKIFEREMKVLCIITEKVFNTSKFAPPMPSNVRVKLYKEEEGTRVYIVQCPDKLSCFDAVMNLVYQAYEDNIPSLLVFLECPEMRQNEILLTKVNDDGEVIKLGIFVI